MTTNNVLDFSSWTSATANLNWGVQRALYETLGVVAEGKATLVYGVDDYDGSPGLINAVANMLSLDVNAVSPSTWFPAVVRAFDNVNRELAARGINPNAPFVSETTAEILMANFGTMKPVPTEEDFAKVAAEALVNAPYVEPSDAEFAEMLAAADNVPAPEDIIEACSICGIDVCEYEHEDPNVRSTR